jgi:hypothetical protein
VTSANDEWKQERIMIDEQSDPPTTISKEYLYLASMTNSEFREYIKDKDIGDKEWITETRRLAESYCMMEGINPLGVLMQHGEEAYQKGCREEWAVYAHKKANTNRYGCLAIAVIATWVIYYIFK